MILYNSRCIKDTDSWLDKAPPAKKDLHWKCGRSAYELAVYITKTLPACPTEIEQCLRDAGIDTDKSFCWDGEVVTKFGPDLGRGYGRHHDAALWNDDVFVGIEAKADESLDKTVSTLMDGASANRMKRLDGLCGMIYGDAAENHPDIRYQLLTALGGVLLEANGCTKERGGPKKNAVLLIITFLKEGVDCKGHPYFSSDKVERNTKDIEQFLTSLGWNPLTGSVVTQYGRINHIDAFVKHFTIRVE